MLADDREKPDYSHLYEVPVETLNLSQRALKALARVGITSVGDCLDYFALVGKCEMLVPFGFLEVMHAEVREKIKQHGYIPADEIDS